jgi:L-lactate dehydrogenase (cytochrome)
LSRAIHSVEDARELARRRLPKAIFEFVNGGAEDEVTLAANRNDFAKLTLLPRMLADVSGRDLSVTLWGEKLALPVLLGPAGLQTIVHAEGELASARAAAAAGTVFVASTASGYTIEEIAKASSGPLWFQLYLWRDRRLVESLVTRAREAGYRALVLTVDVPAIGNRERDVRNQVSLPPRIQPAQVMDGLRHLDWVLNTFAGRNISQVNLQGIDSSKYPSLAAYVNSLPDPLASWLDLDWLRSIWKGPLLIKGILTPEDARRSVACGVDGIIVSNHGGRQLDGAPSTISVLPGIVDAVGGRAEVLIDGGICRGSDVIKAIAIGAKACLIGKAYFLGLGAAGEAGVRSVLRVFAEEIDRTLTLIGRKSLADLDTSVIGRADQLPTERPVDNRPGQN